MRSCWRCCCCCSSVSLCCVGGSLPWLPCSCCLCLCGVIAPLLCCCCCSSCSCCCACCCCRCCGGGGGGGSCASSSRSPPSLPCSAAAAAASASAVASACCVSVWPAGSQSRAADSRKREARGRQSCARRLAAAPMRFSVERTLPLVRRAASSANSALARNASTTASENLASKRRPSLSQKPEPGGCSTSLAPSLLPQPPQHLPVVVRHSLAIVIHLISSAILCWKSDDGAERRRRRHALAATLSATFSCVQRTAAS